MSLVVLPLEMLDTDMSVLLSGRKTFVSEQLLDAAQIRATLQQVSSEAVTQGMWRHSAADFQSESKTRHDALNVSRMKPFSAQTHKDGNIPLLVRFGQSHDLLRFQISLKSAQRVAA